MQYNAPTSEYLFLLGHVFAPEVALLGNPVLSDLDLVAEVLGAVGRISAERLVPLAVPADRLGARMVDGRALCPPGYAELYDDLRQDGWLSLSVDEEDGGQGLPLALSFAADEFLSSGSIGFALCPILRLAAYRTLCAVPNTLDPAFRANLASGEWGGTMCLTEAHCGTDVSLIRTRAAGQPDGSYLLTGAKVFITSGDHDLTDNILHLVLARIDGAAAGLGGLGLFAVPKLDRAADGGWTRPNGVFCDGLESKMGIHSSPTAQLRFDAARGWLVGAPGAGLAAMFEMMTLARVNIAFQAAGVAEIATQNALAYAHDRVQGRDLVTGGKAPVAIAQHPNIRRDLLRMRVQTSCIRLLSTLTALTLDQHLANRGDATVEALLSSLMPISKALGSEMAVEVATSALHMHGGHGYIRDHGMELLLRDVSILPIYEGTNEVQALDLVLRRVAKEDGRAFCTLCDWVEAQLACDAPEGHKEATRRTLTATREIAADLRRRMAGHPFTALQMARDFLWLAGHAVLAGLWLRAGAALPEGERIAGDADARRAEAAFYFAYLHPEVLLREARLRNADALGEALGAPVPARAA